jgi:hypothetical protein
MIHEGSILLLYAEAGVCHDIGESSIVGEKQQTLGILVQSTHWIEPPPISNQLHYGVLRVTIVYGGHDARGLVHGQINVRTSSRDRLAVNLDERQVWVDECRWVRHHRAIDGHPPLGKKALARSA